MGVEFINGTVRRTTACDVCKTVFLPEWPLGRTVCHECGVPLCEGCVPEHQCRQRAASGLDQRRLEFIERVLQGGAR
jgi:hypothetical protein